MQQFAEKRLGFVVHGFEIFRPVRYFQQRQPDAFEVQNSLGGFSMATRGRIDGPALKLCFFIVVKEIIRLIL